MVKYPQVIGLSFIIRGFTWVLITIASLFITMNYQPKDAYAIVDPLVSPNNKFGIHIISATSDEASPAALLVNSSGGDWGYITILIESGDRNPNKWQTFFNELRRRHLIPLVRLATQPDGGNWKLPYEGEEVAWADFLDNLVWPTKNRYVIIYNEPNQGQEWGGQVDPASFARILDKTISTLKNKNPDFFILNPGFDASAPSAPPRFADEVGFLQQMNEEVPGIFNKLDGWVSHSYPNPGFTGSPNSFDRGSVRTWLWELKILKNLGVDKDLPVFITETGWKHAEGVVFDQSLPPAETVGENFKFAFQNVWVNPQIVAVTPFLLNYQEPPFDHFSFKKLTGEKQNLKILGISFPDFYPPYQTIMDLPKYRGRPIQENKGKLIKSVIYPSIVAGESYTIPLIFENTGQSIWNEDGQITLKVVQGQRELDLQIEGESKELIEPGQSQTFDLRLKAPQSGTFQVILQLNNGDKIFDQSRLEFTTEVKSPVILKVTTVLLWKNNFAGDYFLWVTSDLIQTFNRVQLDKSGQSKAFEVRELLPDYIYQFTLQKPFYKSKVVQSKLRAGVNSLDFGRLEPDFLSALFNPKELWKLLPWVNGS